MCMRLPSLESVVEQIPSKLIEKVFSVWYIITYCCDLEHSLSSNFLGEPLRARMRRSQADAPAAAARLAARARLDQPRTGSSTWISQSRTSPPVGKL